MLKLLKITIYPKLSIKFVKYSKPNLFTLNFLQMITKLNLGFFFFFFFLLFSPFLRGQTQQFVLKDAKVNESIKEKINANVEEYEIFELNLSAIDSYLKSYTPDKEIPLKITIASGRTVELKFVENEIRAPNYTHLVVKEKYTELVPMRRCDTYKSLDKTNGMRPTLFSSSKYFSLSFFENGERKTLVSLSRFVNMDSLKNLKNILVLYKDIDWKQPATECPLVGFDTLNNNQSIQNTPDLNLNYYLELAVVTDYEYNILKGSTTEEMIRNDILQVSNRYEIDFNLSVKIVFYEEFLSISSSYPFTSSGILNRWYQLKSYFNPVTSPQGTNPPSPYAGIRQCVQRDAVIIFTHTSGNPGVVATEGVKSICGTDKDTWLSLGPGFCDDRTGFAYSVVNSSGDWKTAAHEIAHNFGALHTTSDCGIMSAIATFCNADQFLSESKDVIYNHIHGTGAYPYACPPHRPGDCLLNVPIEPSQVDVLGPDIVCNGSATFSTNTNVWAIWDTDDPDVSLPIVRVDYTMTAYCSTPGGHSIKASFFHNCQWVTIIKYFWVGSPQPPVVYSNEDACNNGSACQTLTFAFDKLTTTGIDNFSISNLNCTWCNAYSTGSFEDGAITIWNIHQGECISVTATAYNECSTTDFSQVYCNGQVPRREEDIQVKAYPNPADSKLYLVSKNTGTISIWNVLGKQLNNYSVEAHSEIEVETNKYPDGVYLVKFDSPEAKIVKKITITH